MPTLDPSDKQGGKLYGQMVEQMKEKIDVINKELLEVDHLKDVDDLPEKLESFKAKFIEFDQDCSMDIDIVDLKKMLEKLGQAKTHLELVAMIKEVDTTNSGTITYKEFVDMMLGLKRSVLRLILMFEEKNKQEEKPTGPPPKLSLADLP